jgi:hypothetical protein
VKMRTRSYLVIILAMALVISGGAYALLINNKPAALAVPTTASITLSPPAGPVQTPITVTGSGFNPGATVDLYWFGYMVGSHSLGYYPIKTGITAGSGGDFITTINAPYDFGVNVLHNVNATQDGNGQGVVNATFNLVPSIRLETQPAKYKEGQEVMLQVFGAPAEGIMISPAPGAPPELPILKFTYDNNYWGWILSHMTPVPVATGFPTGDAGGNATIRFNAVGGSKIHTIRAYEGSVTTVGPWLGCEIGGEVTFEVTGIEK